MVVPLRRISAITSYIVSTRMGARPSDGSSMSMIRGALINPRPMVSICCSPPESVPASWFMRSFRRGKSVYTFSRSEAMAARSLRRYAPIIRLSRTVRLANTKRPSGT